MSQDSREARASIRFDIKNPPKIGSTVCLNSGEYMTFDGIAMAGLVIASDTSGQRHYIHPSKIGTALLSAAPDAVVSA